MTQATEQPRHSRLTNGIELAILPTARRSVAAIEMRFLGGFAYEKADRLGAAHLLAETLTKGTHRRDGRALNDAFDEIGAGYSVSAARETLAFSCLCLPEFTARSIALLAEMILEPSLPADACEVALDLARQSLAALEDDPLELAKKRLHKQAYGDPLNRHVYGEPETLDRMTRDDILEHWRTHLRPDRLLASVAGAVDPAEISDLFERLLPHQSQAEPTGRPPLPSSFPLRFLPGRSHHPKQLEQEHIAVCFPGVSAADKDEPIERVTAGVLSGGMSSRLWRAIREKQGLVYWVGAWLDHPRSGGMVHLGSACTPQNLEETFHHLLAEIDRLADDVTGEEVGRAVNGILAAAQTHGDTTRSKAIRMVNDLFYEGRPVPLEKRLEAVRAVTAADVCRYLREHPRDQLSIVTVGPSEMKDTTGG